MPGFTVRGMGVYQNLSLQEQIDKATAEAEKRGCRLEVRFGGRARSWSVSLMCPGEHGHTDITRTGLDGVEILPTVREALYAEARMRELRYMRMAR